MNYFRNPDWNVFFGCILFASAAFIWGWVVIAHDVFEEWDGVMHFFSGSFFWESFKYEGWASNFWPPLQPLVISLGDPLFIGKCVAVLAGVSTLIFAYQKSIYNGLNKRDSFFVVLLTVTSSSFILAFSIVENHAMETGLSLLGMMFFSLSKKGRKYLALSAFCVALAGLTRYTSYIFALMLAVICVSKFNRKGFFDALVFSSVFVLVSLPWWIPNYVMNGSPLATWQYLNVGSSIHPEGSLAWWWGNQDNYDGMSGLIRDYPIAFIENLFKNAVTAGGLTLKGVSSHVYTSAFLCIAVIFLLAKRWRSSIDFIIFNKAEVVTAIGYILLCSLAFVFHDALLPVIMIFTVLVGVFIVKNFRYGVYVILAASSANVFPSYHKASEYLNFQDERGGQLASLKEVSEVLISDNVKIVSSIHPSRAFYADSGWIMFPLHGVSSVCDVVDYSVSEKIYNYAPKKPVNLNKDDLSITHIVAGPQLKKMHSFLGGEDYLVDGYDCGSYSVKSIYEDSKNVSVYKVITK